MIKFDKEFYYNECLELAKSRGGTFLSEKYITSNTKYIWKCKNENHKPFQATHNNIKTKNTWCPFCSYEKIPERNKLLFTGRKVKEETKEKMRYIAKERGFGLWMKGRTLSNSTREKLSKSLRGHLVGVETRNKISLKNKAENNGMFNKKHSSEIKEKISEFSKSMWKNPSYIKKMREYFDSPRGRENCRRGALKAGLSLKNKGYAYTKPEIYIHGILKELDVQFEVSYPITNIEHFYLCDIYIPKQNAIIEVDGVYWHNYPNLRELDLMRNDELKSAGYKLLRIWENELEKSKEKIVSFLGEK